MYKTFIKIKKFFYCSLKFQEEGRAQVLACMSSLSRTADKEMFYEVAPCQRMSEKEVGDCGVLAIAMATAIANNIDPIRCFFHSKDIRQHLMQCFEDGKITMFPFSERRCVVKRGQQLSSVPVFCYCRRTDYRNSDKWEIIECDKCQDWFHKMCVTDYPSQPDEVTWYCENCK